MRKQENREKRRLEHYNREDTNGKLIINLRDLGHTMRSLDEGRGSQKRILIVLGETGPITQQELTEHLRIQPASASEVIAKLENAGLVIRSINEADRRTAVISLTEQGLRQSEEARAQRIERHRQMFSALSGEEKEQLLRLTEKLNSDWETRYAGRREHPHEEGRGHGHREDAGWGRPDCNHDCANCPHPCGRSRNR